MDAEYAIQAASLTKVYRSGGTEVVVFKNLSLSVRQGEQVAIIGESGAGKSTLLHLLGGLDRPTSGSILYGNQDVTQFRDHELAAFRNRSIGFVWQNPSLLPEFTALENIAMPLLIRGIDREHASQRAAQILDEVGLAARARHLSGELSGGEQQRIVLARALVGMPKVLLADEPTGNLDFRTGESIMNLLAELHASHNLTSVFVTHNLSFADRCDRVLELRKGYLSVPAEDWQVTGVIPARQPSGAWSTEMDAQASAQVLPGRNQEDATRLDGGTYV
ncbi:MAG TPA: ABC transporter ATP-binding protein [Bryobacteraceae bacterium]|nr:ABC transporter ATP-binding protein [Bryobacteraceae bacterium]